MENIKEVKRGNHQDSGDCGDDIDGNEHAVTDDGFYNHPVVVLSRPAASPRFVYIFIVDLPSA